jgi:hypothetical protein
MLAMLRRFPLHGWIGFVLIAVFWPLNWALDGLRTHWGFFPLWLGYALAVDGLVLKRTGTSLAARSWKKYIGIFLISAPAWWLFEVLNWRIANWHYDGREFFTNIEYAILATLSFSTVMPAVFGTAELAGSLPFIRNVKSGPIFSPSSIDLAALFLSAVVDFNLLNFGTHQYLDGQSQSHYEGKKWRMAYCSFLVRRRFADRIFLGILELLGLS